MPEYQQYPISTDPVGELTNFIAELQSYWPNWEPNEGSLAYRVAAALTRMIAEGRDVGSLIPDEVFRRIGVELFQYPSIIAAPAVADTTWTMQDNAGYDPIPAGTVVSFGSIYFQTVDELVIPSGETVFTPVGIVALDEGSAGNNLGGPGAPLTLEEPYEYVASVTLNSATANGEDLEPIAVYLSRLREYLTLLTPRAITTQNLATLARTVPGVERALAIKGYNPTDDTENNEGMATVAVVDRVGGVVPTPTKDLVYTTLMGPGDRLINSEIFIVDPTHTPVDVTGAAVAYPGVDPAIAKAQADDAIAALFDPNMWGQRQSGETREWYMKRAVRRSDIIGALEALETIDYVDEDALMIGLDGGTPANENVDLPGIAPLPTPGDIDITVTVP